MSSATLTPPDIAADRVIDAVIARALDGVVQVESGRPAAGRRSAHSGAGMVWARDERGRALVVSNAHVVTGNPVWVTGRDGERRAASEITRDANRDLALVLVDETPGSWRAVPSSSTSRVRVGQVAMALGHPLGVLNAVTTGVVHAVGPLQSDIELPAPQRALPWAQLDVMLAPGNSGGPVIDATGHFIGISTMIARGLGLAIPADAVDRFVAAANGPSLLAFGWTRDA